MPWRRARFSFVSLPSWLFRHTNNSKQKYKYNTNQSVILFLLDLLFGFLLPALFWLHRIDIQSRSTPKNTGNVFGFVLWIWLNIHFQWASLPAGWLVKLLSNRLGFDYLFKSLAQTRTHTHTLTHHFPISISKWARRIISLTTFGTGKADGGRQFQWYTTKVLIYVVIQSIQFIHLGEHTHAHSSGHVPFRLISKTCYKYRFNSKSSSNSTVPMGAEALLPESMWNTFLTLSPSLSLAHFLFEYSKICGLVHGHSKFVQNIDGHFAFWSTK